MKSWLVESKGSLFSWLSGKKSPIFTYIYYVHIYGKINSIPSVTNSDLFLTAADSNYTDQTAPMVTHPPSPTQDPLAETYGKDCDLLKKWLTRFKRREKKRRKTLWSYAFDLNVWVS